MQPFKLEQLFGSKTRARLLALFLSAPKESYFVRELTRKIDAQLNSVRRELKNLVELGLVEELDSARSTSGGTLADKKKYYAANRESPLFEDLRSFFQKVQILMKQSLVQDIQKHGDVDYIAFTGRFVGRTDVPTDMVIVGSVPPKALQDIVAAFEKELGHEVNYTTMTKDEYAYRMQVNDRFLGDILDGEKIVILDRLHDRSL